MPESSRGSRVVVASGHFGERLATWIYRHGEILLLFLLFAGPPPLRRRDPTASLSGTVDLAAGIQLAVWLAAGLWILTCLFKRREGGGVTLSFPRLPVPVVLGCLLGLFLAASSIVSAYPPLTIVRGYQVGVACLVGFFFSRRLGTRSALTFLRRGLALMGYAVFAAYLIDPDLVYQSDPAYFRLRGDEVTPTAAVGLLLFVICIAWPPSLPWKAASRSGGGNPRRRWTQRPLRQVMTAPWLAVIDNRAVLFFLSSALVILARSRVGMALYCAVGIVTVILLGRQWPVSGKLLTVLVAIGAALAIWLALEEIREWVVRNPVQLAHLSHRLPLWVHLLGETIERSPFIGLGFIAASRVLGPQVVPELANAHSAFLEVAVGGGLLALGLYLTIWAGLLLRSAIAVLRHETFGVLFFLLAFAIAGLAITTSHAILPWPPSFTFWCLVSLVPLSTRPFLSSSHLTVKSPHDPSAHDLPAVSR